MDADTVFDTVIRDHNINSCNTEEELLIAAKLGKELLQQNNEIQERNRALWHSHQESIKEIGMLRQQNRLLREEAESKSTDQILLERKNTDLERETRLLEKEVSELQSLNAWMRRSVQETERVYMDESKRSESLSSRVCELEKEIEMLSPRSHTPDTLSPMPERTRRSSYNYLQSTLNRSEDAMRCLEEDTKYLLEEYSELCRKIALLEEKLIVTDHNRFDASIIQNDGDVSLLENTVDEELSDCESAHSFTSQSWLTEKLTALEERYNHACENCICGACEPITNADGGINEVSELSYRELFDQLFDGLRSSKIKTPHGTLKRKPQKSGHSLPPK